MYGAAVVHSPGGTFCDVAMEKGAADALSEKIMEQFNKAIEEGDRFSLKRGLFGVKAFRCISDGDLPCLARYSIALFTEERKFIVLGPYRPFGGGREELLKFAESGERGEFEEVYERVYREIKSSVEEETFPPRQCIRSLVSCLFPGTA